MILLENWAYYKELRMKQYKNLNRNILKIMTMEAIHRVDEIQGLILEVGFELAA